ncbi:MAG: hypothetical protein Q8P62_01590 [Candidatus Peregrinibacteria bacterium]|nr:hypothetical protein [Candidatus Peregrinibacteria bacterium]
MQPAFPDDKVDALVQEVDGELIVACPFLRQPTEASPLLCGRILQITHTDEVAAGCPYSTK